jgi:hypothetical protein
MSDGTGNLLPKLKELVPLYEKVKQAIFLAEYEDGLELPLTSINELRNCLDHIMRILSEGHNVNSDYEYVEAKAHLYRACNDSYEIIVMKKLTILDSFKNKFDMEAINQIFPEYFTKVLPFASKAQKQLAQIRAKKPVVHEEENTFSVYENVVAQLMEHVDKFHELAPGIIEYQKGMSKKTRRGKRSDFIISVVIGGVIVGIIILVIQRVFF